MMNKAFRARMALMVILVVVAGVALAMFVAAPAADAAAAVPPTSAVPAANAAAVEVMPRDGSRLIVQPASLTVVTQKALRSASFSVTDGCGRPVRLGSAAVLGTSAGVPLPGQEAGVGGWAVRWQTVDRAGRTRSGQWRFSIVDGFSCPGPGGAVQAIGGHHRSSSELAAQVRSINANSAPAQPNPGLATLAAVLAGLACAVRALIWLRRRRPVSNAPSPADVTAVVITHAAIFGVLTAGNGTALWVRAALGVPTALLATAAALGAAARGRTGLCRALRAGITGAAVTGALTALWAIGRSVLLVVAPTETFSGAGLLILSTALVTGLLTAGGWYGQPPPKNTTPRSAPHPADRRELVSTYLPEA